MQRGQKIGVCMEDALQTTATDEERDAALAAATDPSVVLPQYYLSPFHAYADGNLSWEAALEVEIAGQSVFATVMDPANKAVRADGAAVMRNAFHAIAKSIAAKGGANTEVSEAVDMGASVGVSSLALSQAFPCARIQGAPQAPVLPLASSCDRLVRFVW